MSTPNLKELPIEAIQPKNFNPNRKSKSQYEQHKAEFQRLGGPSKPIVVRPRDSGKYEIMDGEHTYAFAVEAGMKKVLCEVRDADNFDAMRETFLRNRGGHDDRVVLGRMFKSMMAERNLSNRGLAIELKMSEGKVRGITGYADAAELRNHYAPQTADEDIARLSHYEVRTYTGLPETVRDRWLDSGADTEAFYGIGDWPSDHVASEIHRYKLAEFLDTTSTFPFRESVEWLTGLCMWASRHGVDKIKEYLRPVASLGLPADVLNCLPLEQQGSSCVAIIPPAKWKKVLASENKKTDDLAGLVSLAQSGVNVALRDAGHDLSDVLGPDVAEALQIVADGPEFIRKADFLSLDEKRFLVEIEVETDEETLAAAKQQAVELAGKEREKSKGDQGSRRKTRKRSKPINKVFEECLVGLLRQREFDETEELFSDRDRLFSDVLQELENIAEIQDGVVDGAPAKEVLRDRLDEVPWAEFYLIAAGVLGMPMELAASNWLQAVRGEGAAHDEETEHAETK